ncbi:MULTISPECIES: hypothetical protein [Bacillus cereus group]|nr:hypothetical protein [Bacillus thuringiensis]WLP67109.1 hypothetical protein Q9G86_28640 [Bacillus thuringiensis]
MKDVKQIYDVDQLGVYLASNLIDESTATKWVSGNDNMQTMTIQFTSPKRFTSYEMTYTEDTEYKGPKQWVLVGANDYRSTGTILHTVSDQAEWSPKEKRTFTFENPSEYLYYRFINMYYASGFWVQLSEVNFIEPVVKVLTTDDFKKYGMTDLSVIPESAWSQLSDNFKILVLTKDTNINSASANVTAAPKRMLVMQEADMRFEKPIKSFTLAGTVQNKSVLKVIASNDSGATWKAFDGSIWNTVNINSLDDVEVKGMDMNMFNGITQEVWKPFLSGMKLRLAYYLDIGSATDSLIIDKLSYETVPVVGKSPKLNGIKIETNNLTIEGRLKELERINAINIAKLNFKSNALLQSDKYEMHDMVIDTCELDSMKTISSSGAGELQQEIEFSNAVELGLGKVSEIDISTLMNIQKIEVK